MRGSLLFLHEAEAACLERLLAQGFEETHALEISSYLAQSTDIVPEFPAIARECAARGVEFLPVTLDEAPEALAGRDPAMTLVWTLTDGMAYFRGGAGPALARLNELPTVGADHSAFALCQDKFRSGAVLAALGLPVPGAALARDGALLSEPPPAPDGYFVKPNRLGSKVGIWPQSRCRTLDQALELSRRIFAAYRDDAVIQAYVRGRNARASFLAVEPDAGLDALSVAFVESGSDFQTMADSLALYGESGARAIAEGRYEEPLLVDVAAARPAAAVWITQIAARLMLGLGLRDVFSMDLRVEDDDTVHLVEFEVCPGLPCFDFRAYCRSRWNMDLAAAIAATAASRLPARQL